MLVKIKLPLSVIRNKGRYLTIFKEGTPLSIASDTSASDTESSKEADKQSTPSRPVLRPVPSHSRHSTRSATLTRPISGSKQRAMSFKWKPYHDK